MKLSVLKAMVDRMCIKAKDEDPEVFVYSPSRGKPYFYEIVEYEKVERLRVNVILDPKQPLKLGDFCLDLRDVEERGTS